MEGSTLKPILRTIKFIIHILMFTDRFSEEYYFNWEHQLFAHEYEYETCNKIRTSSGHTYLLFRIWNNNIYLNFVIRFISEFKFLWNGAVHRKRK